MLRRIESKIDKLIALITKEGQVMAKELDDLKQQVAKTTDVEQSAVVLLKGLKDKLDQAIATGDPQALMDLSSQLGTSQAALAAAITANTPESPPTPEPPTPTPEPPSSTPKSKWESEE